MLWRLCVKRLNALVCGCEKEIGNTNQEANIKSFARQFAHGKMDENVKISTLSTNKTQLTLTNANSLERSFFRRKPNKVNTKISFNFHKILLHHFHILLFVRIYFYPCGIVVAFVVWKSSGKMKWVDLNTQQCWEYNYIWHKDYVRLASSFHTPFFSFSPFSTTARTSSRSSRSWKSNFWLINQNDWGSHSSTKVAAIFALHSIEAILSYTIEVLIRQHYHLHACIFSNWTHTHELRWAHCLKYSILFWSRLQ